MYDNLSFKQQYIRKNFNEFITGWHDEAWKCEIKENRECCKKVRIRKIRFINFNDSQLGYLNILFCKKKNVIYL